MKKLFGMIGLMMMMASPAYAATAAIQGFCSTGGTKVVTQGMSSSTTVQVSYPNCSVIVYLTGTTNKATLYKDNLNTPLGNPFTANSNASWLFYATSGVGYDVVLYGGTPVPFPAPFTLTDVLIGGTGGGGGSPSGPQYAIQTSEISSFGHSNAFTDATGNPLTVPGTLTGNLTNGGYNLDQFVTGSGNNGLANLLAGSCAGGNCTAMFPATSTSTERGGPWVSSTHVQDYRKGSQGDYFYNPLNGGGAGFNPTGETWSGAKAIYGTWDLPTLTPGNYPSETQQSLGINTTFASPGFNFGTDTGTPGPLWAVQHAISIHQTVNTQGIGQMIGGQQDKYATGDSAAGYFYNFSDGGFKEGAGEGTTGIGMNGGQHSTWWHGTANAGNTSGTQLLQATNTNVAYSRSQTTTEGTMLDLSSPIVSAGHVTGPPVQVPSYAAWATPIDTTVTPSTAYALANAAIPAPIGTITPQSDTVSFTVTGGTNAGGFTTGMACLDGSIFYEQVAVTAVGAISGGVQSVTFTHRFPNPSQTSLWQGGPCGGYYLPTATTTYMTGWRVAYPVFGATDSSHIVGRFFTGANGAAVGSNPIPNFWGVNSANRALVNLVATGTTVTANFSGTNQTLIMNGQANAVISSASNAAFNGTISNVVLSNNNQTLTWTQTGVSGTSATANISLVPAYFAFDIVRGASVPQPSTTAGIPLEPNNAPWATGDVLENVFDPSFSGYNISSGQTVNSPDSAAQPGLGNMTLSASGNGISGQYRFFSAQNQNSPSLYIGSGGVLDAPLWTRFLGPGGTLMYTQYAPMNGLYFFDLGCFVTAQGGCTGNNDYKVLSVGRGTGEIDFTGSNQSWYFKSNIKTGQLSAGILSTGTSTYINGGFTGTPVALTSAGSVHGNNSSAMGVYGAFGNETPLDTSAKIAAAGFYAGQMVAGALPPTTSTVHSFGTTGSTTYSYACTSVTQYGQTLPSTPMTTTNGNAVLGVVNNNGIQCLPGYGSQSINVYRVTTVGSYAAGLICANVPNQYGLSSAQHACTDIGQAAGAAMPTVDTSGLIQSPSAVFGAATVGGSAVCRADGTNCPAIGGYITSLTTTGTSGPSTVTGGVLNIPQYTGGSMTWPATPGIAVYAGSNAWGTSLTAPTGAIVGTTDTQTLTNKTLGAGTGFSDGTGVGGGYLAVEGTTRAGAASNDAFWADSTAHRLMMNNNNGGAVAIASLSDFASSSLFGVVKVDGTSITSVGGVISASGSAPIFPWSCQPGLGDGLNVITAGTYLQTSCYNDTAHTVTLTGIKCYADAGTPTMNVTNGAGTGLLTGAVTCSSSFASGTQSGTVTIAAGDYLKFTLVASGTAKQATFVVTGTHP